jgi:hypothetical protein
VLLVLHLLRQDWKDIRTLVRLQQNENRSIVYWICYRYCVAGATSSQAGLERHTYIGEVAAK